MDKKQSSPVVSDQPATITVAIRLNGQDVSLFGVEGKIFSTGSRGFNGNQRVTINGVPYQVGINLVEIGSKPKKD